MKVYSLILKPITSPKDITINNLTIYIKATSIGDAFTKVSKTYAPNSPYEVVEVKEAIDTNIL